MEFGAVYFIVTKVTNGDLQVPHYFSSSAATLTTVLKCLSTVFGSRCSISAFVIFGETVFPNIGLLQQSI